MISIHSHFQSWIILNQPKKAFACVQLLSAAMAGYGFKTSQRRDKLYLERNRIVDISFYG